MTAERAGRHGLYAYPWDVAEQDQAGFAAELRTAGIDTLCLATAYHAGKFLRPHGASSPVYFPEDGTVHCRVRPERYGRIRPRESAVALDGDPFGRFAGRGDIGVTAWAVLMHNTRLGTAHPDAVARNAFGDPYWYSLCPANPEVQDYAVALCADIAERYPVRGLVLESAGWMAYRHGYHHEFALVGANPWLDAMLGLCFCRHCVAGATQAGIAAAALRERVAARVRDYLAAPLDTPEAIGRSWLACDLAVDAELGAFLRWRCGVLAALVARIRQAVRADAALFVIPTTQHPVALGWLEGADFAALAREADGLELCLYKPDWQSAVADLEEVRRRAGPRPLRCILRPGPPDAEDEANFARKVAELSRAGVDGISFYNFGHLRRSHLGWIGRALAAAKESHRETS
jgi:hypothetical protein